MKKLNVALATLVLAASSFGFSAMADDELNKSMANSTKPPKGTPATIIMKQDGNGNVEIAVDNIGACQNKKCDLEKLVTLKYTPVKQNTRYTGELKELAQNELNRDPGANRESWFFWGGGWGLGWGWGWGAAAYAYRPYWGGYGYPYAYGGCNYGAYSWWW